MTFDIGEWFDEYFDGRDCDLLLKDIKISFGEKSLKEWFDSMGDVEPNSFETVKEFFFSDLKSAVFYFDLLAVMAVSCLGEKRCLELLKKWWEEKR